MQWSSFVNISVALFSSVTPKLTKAFTVDNGSEFARFKNLEKAMGSRVYFADPFSHWQRSLNENLNGLLKYYFPKGGNFYEISDIVIQQVVDKLNHRSRKCLNFKTP